MQLINIGSPVSAGGAPDLPPNFLMTAGAISSGAFSVNQTHIAQFIPKMNCLANRLWLYNSASHSGSIVGGIYSADGSERLASFDHTWTSTNNEITLSSDADIKGDQLYWLLFNNKGTANSVARVNTSGGRSIGENQFIVTPGMFPMDDINGDRGHVYTSETITEAPAAIDLSESVVDAMSKSSNHPWFGLSRSVT